MKTYKQIDFWGSLILIIAALRALMFRFEIAFSIRYFGLGAWQFISMISQSLTYKVNKLRIIYNRIILVLLCLCLVNILLVVFFELNKFTPIMPLVMLFISPILAIFYTIICYHETYGTKPTN